MLFFLYQKNLRCIIFYAVRGHSRDQRHGSIRLRQLQSEEIDPLATSEELPNVPLDKDNCLGIRAAVGTVNVIIWRRVCVFSGESEDTSSSHAEDAIFFTYSSYIRASAVYQLVEVIHIVIHTSVVCICNFKRNL